MKIFKHLVLCTLLNGSKKSFIFLLLAIDELVGDQKSITWEIILVEPITICHVLDIAGQRYQIKPA